MDQVPALKELLETRNRLRDLLTRVDRSEELEVVLEEVLTDESEMKSMSSSLEERQSGNGSSEGEAPAEGGEESSESTE